MTAGLPGKEPAFNATVLSPALGALRNPPLIPLTMRAKAPVIAPPVQGLPANKELCRNELSNCCKARVHTSDGADIERLSQ
jgi:hypothetical protein